MDTPYAFVARIEAKPGKEEDLAARTAHADLLAAAPEILPADVLAIK